MRSRIFVLPMFFVLAATAFGQQPVPIKTNPIKNVPEFEIVVPDPPTAFRADDQLL